MAGEVAIKTAAEVAMRTAAEVAMRTAAEARPMSEEDLMRIFSPAVLVWWVNNEGTRRGSGRRIRLRLRDREGLATVSQA